MNRGKVIMVLVEAIGTFCEVLSNYVLVFIFYLSILCCVFIVHNFVIKNISESSRKRDLIRAKFRLHTGAHDL